MRQNRFGSIRRSQKCKAINLWLVGLACLLLLSSCSTSISSAKAPPFSFPNLTSPGTVKVNQNVSITSSSPSVFNLGSSPNIALARPLFISKSGFLAESQVNGSQSDIFLRANPLGNWIPAGSIPGRVEQLDFDTLSLGFALVGSNTFSSTSLYSTSNGGRHWILVSTGKYVQVHFFNNRDGVALASPPTGPGLGAEILITSDGGRHWSTEATTAFSHISVFGVNYASFSFISAKVGWLAIGGQPGAGSEEKWLLNTANGGQTWTQIASTPPLGSPVATEPNAPGLPMGGYMDQIRFTTSLHGYMVLGRGGRGAVLETADGGVHWKGKQLLPGNDYRSTAIAEIALGTPFGGIIVTQLGSIWNQANSRDSWKQIYPPYRAVSLSYRSGQLDATTEKGRVLALGLGSSSGSKILGNFGINTEAVNVVPEGVIAINSTAIEIKRAGKAWTKMPIPAAVKQINYGRFLNSSVGLIEPGPPTAELEATQNGGLSWTKIPLPFIPFSLDPLSATDWWVVGEVSGPLVPNAYKKNIHVRTYSLYHTVNAGRSWTEYKANWGSGGILTGVDFYSSSVGYAWTSNTLFSTTNGGLSYISHPMPKSLVIPNAESLTAGEGGQAWMVSGGYPVFETKNLGATWSDLG